MCTYVRGCNRKRQVYARERMPDLRVCTSIREAAAAAAAAAAAGTAAATHDILYYVSEVH